MKKATTVYKDGVFFTMDASAPTVEAMAIRDGVICAIGHNEDMSPWIGPETKTVSMGGRFAMPGLIEPHTHAIWGACRDLFETYFGYSAPLREITDTIRKKANTLSGGEWLSGGPMRNEFRAQLGMSPRDWLDSINSQNPLAFYDTTMHVYWCNSKALTLCGYNEEHPEIPGGKIERDENGRLTGVLAETAIAPIKKFIEPSEAQFVQAARFACEYYNRYGYTAFKDAAADEKVLKAFATICDDQSASVHIAAHISAFSPMSGGFVEIEHVKNLKALYERDGLNLSFAKLFLDGVAPAYTASRTKPYLAKPGYDPKTHDPQATLLIDPQKLSQLFVDYDRAGFTMKVHSIGDNATRVVLDAIEAARTENGPSGLGHEIAHCVFLRDEDLPRFAELDAVAEFSPKLWMPNAATPAQISSMGEDCLTECQRVRSAFEAGAEIVCGTDWPASSPDANPWTGIAGLITRQDMTGQYPGSIAPDQAISLETALPFYTRNGARSMGMDNKIGCLKPGAFADFCVLPGDIRQMHPRDIAGIEIQQTVWKGDVVYEA